MSPPTPTQQDTLTLCSVAARRLSEAGPAAVPDVLCMLSAASGCVVALREAGMAADAADAAEADGDVLRVPLREGQRLAGVLELRPAPPDDSPWAAGSPALSLFTDVLAMAVRCARTAASARTCAGQFLLADEADRAQLAAGLHDGLVQALVAARYLIDLALQPGRENSPVAPRLIDAREAVRDALAEARHLLGWLRPRAGNNVALVPELESMVRREADRSPAASVALTADPSADTPVPPVVAAAAYRLVQCAVDNAHAQMLRDDSPACGPGDGPGDDGGHDDGDVKDGLHIGIRCHGGWFQLTFPTALTDGSCAAMARWLDRAKLLGGSAHIERGALVVRLPVEPGLGLAPRLPAQRYEGYL